MSPLKMRFVLAVSLLLGIATAFNVLGHGQSPTSQTAVSSPPVRLGEVPRANKAPNASGKSAPANGDLQAVRRELMTRGYLINPGNGPLDARTRAAIMAYEFDHGLMLTATPSELTLKNLIFDVTKSRSQTADMPAMPAAVALIERVQAALRGLGYAKSGVSGRLDGATRSAIRAFERARGLESSGRISAPLIDSLGPALAAR